MDTAQKMMMIRLTKPLKLIERYTTGILIISGGIALDTIPQKAVSTNMNTPRRYFNKFIFLRGKTT